MKINVKRDSIWVPDWEGNLELPEKDQIRFHHRFLTTDERDIYIYVEDIRIKDLKDITGEEDDRKWIQNKKGITKAVVTKIENLILVDEKGKETTIDTIDKFYEAPDAFPGLTMLLEGYCLGLVARVDSKNLEPLSGATSKATT